ncbi:MAG: acyltransferase [Mycolicibacterium sp.]|nr:acyltransferase [Mycolicibacterium sp.]
MSTTWGQGPWAVFLSSNDPNAAYFSTFTRVWELGVGALIAIAGPWLTNIPSAARPWMAYTGLAGVLGSLFVIDSTVQFPAPWAAFPVLATALVVASFHGAKVCGMFPLTNPVSRYFGDTSYTLYLWHWPIIVILTAAIPRGPLFYGFALTLVMGFTAVTYRFYENPIRKSDWLLDKPAPVNRRLPTLSRASWATVGSLGAAVVFVSILGIGYSEKISAAKMSVAQELSKSHDQTKPIGDQADPCFGAPAMLEPDCVLRNPDVPLRPSIDQLANDGYAAPCYRGSKEIERDEQYVKSCTYGYAGQDATRIAIIGDSHAAQIMPALLPVLDANKWRLTTYLGTGCKWRMPPAPGGCPIDAIQKELIAEPYDLVLTTSVRGGDAAGYVDAWAPVAAAGSKIAVIADNPANSEDSYACLTRVSLGGDRTVDCSTAWSEAFAKPDPLVAAADTFPGVTTIDLTRYYCRDDRCPSVIGNVIVYRDIKGHLSSTFAGTLAPAVEEGVQRALGG